MLQPDVKPDSFLHHLSPKIQAADMLGSSLTSLSQGIGVVQGHQGAICPEVSFDYKDSPLQNQRGTDLGASCVPYNIIGSKEICLYQGFRQKNGLLSKHIAGKCLQGLSYS